MRIKLIITLVAVVTLCNCIDPYSPELAGYDSLLVVEGLITDANTSYTVKLSRTFQDLNSSPTGVSDASVFISSNGEPVTYLISIGNGIYKTDSLEFTGIIGKTYILHILTSEGKEYQSDSCLMQWVPDIDSLYIAKEKQLTDNGTVAQEGISIYLNSKPGDVDQYYRWDFEETWKFKVPYPKKFNYINEDLIVPVPDVMDFCWKVRKSDNILIRDIYSGESPQVEKQPVFFIASDQSDRLSVQYSILVNQYSISKREYEFWNNLKQINESGGDIFAKQPFTVISNIHNISDSKERVLGYFQVSAVRQKRMNISLNEILKLNMPHYNYPCESWVKDPLDYPNSFGSPPPTWDDLYSIFCKTSDFYFVEPIFIPGTSVLEKMVFARPECADCTFSGTHKKPDFWVDIN